jgi:hypothetical protein
MDDFDLAHQLSTACIVSCDIFGLSLISVVMNRPAYAYLLFLEEEKPFLFGGDVDVVRLENGWITVDDALDFASSLDST